MISSKRSQDLARSFVGDVATPNKSPDRLVSAEAYQAESGAGNMPKASTSRAMVRSDAPSGSRSRTAKPVAMTLLASEWRRSSASRSSRLAAEARFQRRGRAEARRGGKGGAGWGK